MTDRPAYAADTIVAAATPPGTGGIAVVRISGPGVRRIAAAVLGGVPPPRLASLKTFRDAAGQPLDEGIALFFPAPASYTGEDVLELQGHGGRWVVAGIVDAVTARGARRARPGEFSQRAFLNDRLDLVQAEAIADLVEAGSAQAARAALSSLTGAFSAAVHSLQEALTTLRLHVEAAIDFPEDEVDFLTDEALALRMRACEGAFEDLRRRAAAGKLLRDGYRVVIVGPPNAGKSSLLNALSGEDSAIVTELAGTTRDILREIIDLDGLAVELIDTAGLRDDPDRIEAEGIRRAREALARADAVLWMEDAAAPDPRAPAETLPEDIPVVRVRNKIDLTGETPGVAAGDPAAVSVSARTGAGLDALRQLLRDLAGGRDTGEGAFTARQRHLDALAAAGEHFRAAKAALEEARAGELTAEELKLAQHALAEITGGITSDELLGRIFGEFCIGK